MSAYLKIRIFFRIVFVLGAFTFALPIQVWAVACDVIFSNGIQATSATGNIGLSFHTSISGGSATLKSKTLTDNSSWLACSGLSCVASGTAATTSTPTFVTGTGTNGAITVAANGTSTKAAGDYAAVNVGQQATLTFSTANGTYKTQGFTTGYQSIVQLQSGDYWINGNLTLGQETKLVRVATSGTTRIFVNGNIIIDYKITSQSFTSDQLLIYATGSITTGNETNLSAYIYTGGNASFNYLSVINGGISAANFISLDNQITVNYQPSTLATANFSPLCSGVTATPTLLGSWHMDENSWNGTAGEVIDSSGKGNHGRARIAAGSSALPSTGSGTPAFISGSQSTCRYGAFDGTGGTPTRTYSYVELSGFPALPNGFTFAAWIRSTNAGAQHQRILVRDDADNGWGLSLADGTGQPELRFFNRNITNNGAVTGQGVNPNCGVFCLDTNPILTSNAWYYVAAVVDTTAKTVTLYVYNQLGILQARAVGGYSGTWVDGTGTVAIGGETLSSAEGRQTSWHFLGNIDEVNIYSGALSQTSIESLLPAVRTCSGPDHYEVEVPSSGVACLGTDVIVRACADSSVPCTQDGSVNTAVTLGASAGSLNATSLTLASGTATTKLLYPLAADGASSTLTLSNEATAAVNSRKCCTGSSSCVVGNSCSTQFKTAGFVFSKTATGASTSITSEVAGTTDSAVYLRALQTSTTTGACTARFTTPQTVPLAFQCVNPTTCVSLQTLTLSGTSVASNAKAAGSITYTNTSLTFDAQGSAQIPLNYSDVGQVHLLAKLDLAASGGQPAYTLTGTSNDFVVKPASLAVSAVQTAAGVANPATTNTGTGFVSAGTAFKVFVEARNASGAKTPNFGNETTSEINSLAIAANSLVYPTGGTLTALATTGSFSATTPAGTFVHSGASWNQVGTIGIVPSLSDNDYLGAGNIGTFTASGNVGRFFPDHYTLQTGSTVSNGCGSFSYMGQPNINAAYSVNALSTANSVLTNYDNTSQTQFYSAAMATPAYYAENNNDGTALNSRVVMPAVTWNHGVLTLNTSSGQFSRQASGAPDGPFTSLQLGLGLTDTLDARSLQTLNMNSGTTGVCGGGSCTAATIGSTLNLRYGRLRLDDAFGPETVALPVNFVTEYWTGNYFALNTSDSCTLVPRAAVTYPSGSLSTDINRTVTLSSGNTQGTYSNLDVSGIHFSAGTAGQKFTAPSTAGTGTFVVGINLASLSWLTYDWNQNNVYSETTLPNATFSFGSYRGNDRIIYWREKLQ